MVLRFFALVFLSACVATAPARAPSLSLRGTDDASHALTDSRVTVIFFFSEHCPCVRAHDARLVALAGDFEKRGVRFLALDSEVGATIERDRDEARARAYPFPILIDEGGRAAKALGAEYATYSVVLGASGEVLYSGGFDSDHTHLSDHATPYLRDALDDVVANRAVRRAHTEPLGCALRLW